MILYCWNVFIWLPCVLQPALPPPMWAPAAPAYERPRYERPAPMPRPRRQAPPDEYRGSTNELPQQAALHPPAEYVGAGSYPYGLKITMSEEDYWAIANLKYKQLPPIEYDHPVTRAVEVIDVASTEEMRKICHRTDGAIIVGCADVHDPTICRIYLAPIPEWAGITRNVNLRHELGHCNGWSADHPGIR